VDGSGRRETVRRGEEEEIGLLSRSLSENRIAKTGPSQLFYGSI
jgi:hypothetical protein